MEGAVSRVAGGQRLAEAKGCVLESLRNCDRFPVKGGQPAREFFQELLGLQLRLERAPIQLPCGVDELADEGPLNRDGGF